MLKLNVGLSKKMGMANFGSRGATVNIEAEVDGGLIQDPNRLRDHLRRLFGLARASLEEELNPDESLVKSTRPELPPSKETIRPATDAQCRLIMESARRQRIHLQNLVREQTGKQSLVEVSLNEASQLITYLKSRESSLVTQEV